MAGDATYGNLIRAVGNNVNEHNNVNHFSLPDARVCSNVFAFTTTTQAIYDSSHLRLAFYFLQLQQVLAHPNCITLRVVELGWLRTWMADEMIKPGRFSTPSSGRKWKARRTDEEDEVEIIPGASEEAESIPVMAKCGWCW